VLVSEYFRRLLIPQDSGVMSEILKSNCTGRMKAYLEAGCTLQNRNILNINQRELLQFSNKRLSFSCILIVYVTWVCEIVVTLGM
jgi:hypothetical protein